MNQDFQNLKRSLVSGALLLSMMLTGCGDKDNSKKIYVGNKIDITYTSEEGLAGIISQDDVDKYIKIITFKRGDVIFTKLISVKDCYIVGGRFSSNYKEIDYVDLDSGTTLISYRNYDTSGETMNNVKYEVGENLEIVEVRDFMPYLYQEGKFADEYEINDLVNFYHEKVEPTLDDSEELTLN